MSSLADRRCIDRARRRCARDLQRHACAAAQTDAIRARRRYRRYLSRRPGLTDAIAVVLVPQLAVPVLRDRVSDQVRAATKPQFPHAVRFMGFDRLDAEIELGADFLIGMAERDQFEDLELTWTEWSTECGRHD